MSGRSLAAILIAVVLVSGCGGNSEGDELSESRASDDAPADTRGDAPADGTTLVALKAADDPGEFPFTSDLRKETGFTADFGSPRQGAVKATVPGLYGAQRGQSACDTTTLVNELDANPEKLEAFARALALQPSELLSTVSGMVAVVLRSDTLTVDHDFKDGDAVSRLAVLQAGTPVLVDGLGVPVIRCTSGSPLQNVAALPDDAVFEGDEWDDFAPESVITVLPADDPIEVLVVIDPATLEPFLRGIPTEEIPLDSPPVDIDLPLTADLDGDGVPDIVQLEEDPLYADDTDGDGIPDAIEELIGSDPDVLDADADGDGIPDGFEDFFNALASSIDADGDGIPDDLASIFDLLPDIDIDGDGIPDDLGDAFSGIPPIDIDGDGVPDDPFTDLTLPPEEPPFEEPPFEEPPPDAG